MITKKFPLYFLISIVLAAISASCNGDSESYTIMGDFGNCTVTSFNLKKNDSVLAHLDSVYFSIDILNGEIFNADSLPKGTDVSRLLLNISVASAQSCDVTWRIPGTFRDTTVNYIENPSDSVNFSDGPVKMLVTSLDGQTKYEYSISVNVHQVEPDTLYWNKLAMRPLPGDISNPTAQKTVEFNGKVLTLTSDGNSASLSAVENPYDGGWTSVNSILPSGADVSSFTATSDALYIIDNEGNLFTSGDGISWNPTGAVMDYIYGGYENMAIGVRNGSNGWMHITYPATSEIPVEAGCPISGTGQMMVYESKWSVTPFAMVIGGRDASGTVVGSAWGYDGKSWTKISSSDIDEREGVSIFPYFTPKVSSSSWRVTEQSVLVALGGRYETSDGMVASKNVYVSYDQGLNWKEADTYMQLPEYIPGFSDAQTIVVSSTLSASRGLSDNQWTSFASRRLPAWAFSTEIPYGRVIRPIDQWECPFIYLFGGVDAEGNLHDTVWRGVITRFTFRPLY